ncbi:hypothetical protein SLA2020_500400 [Shorea laevis]
MAHVLAAKICPPSISELLPGNKNRWRFGCHAVLPSQEGSSSCRRVMLRKSLVVAVLSLNCRLTPLPVLAEDKSNEEKEEDEGVVGAIKSLFDPNEKTRSGKVLPKAYLKSAREGQEKVASEESYVVLEKAIRSLASFYSKAGPSAPLPDEVKSEILNDLNTAEEFL